MTLYYKTTNQKKPKKISTIKAATETSKFQNKNTIYNKNVGP